MSERISSVPILITAYRRYDYLAQLLTTMPCDRQIYIVVDGPKDKEHSGDVAIVRSLVKAFVGERSNADLLIREENVGGPLGIPSSIDWVLGNEPSVCVIEEDCIPSELAFSYADYISEQARLLPGVAGATLNNFVSARKNKLFHSPFLSLFPHCWGWITDRDSWNAFRPSPDYLQQARSKGVLENLPQLLSKTFPYDFRAQRYWNLIFSDLLKEVRYHWDYTYTLRLWEAGAKFVAPPCNLVSNIGVDYRSQNCKSPSPNHLLSTPDSRDVHCRRSLFSPVQASYAYKAFDRLNQSLVFTPSVGIATRLKSRTTRLLESLGFA